MKFYPRLLLWTCLLWVASTAAADSASPTDRERQLIAVLQSNDPPAEKAITCKKLAVCGTSQAVPALAPLLSDPHLASWARIALEAIPGPAADAALRDAAGRLQGLLLVGVINSIGVRADARSVEVLAAKLADANPEVASAAAVALGRIGTEPAVRALESVLPRAPAGSMSAVAQGCILCAERYFDHGNLTEAQRLYDLVRNANVPEQRLAEATRGAILARGLEGVPLLIETLRSPHRPTVAMGLRTARELPGPTVTEALAKELARVDPSRQGPLLSALADRGDAAVWPVIFNAARSGSKNLRTEAIGAIGRKGNVAGVAVLLDVMLENNPDLAQAVKVALARLPAERVDAELISRLPASSGPNRRTLIEIAGQRRLPDAVPELIKASREADPALRATAIKALGTTVTQADLRAVTSLLAEASSANDLASIEAALQDACRRLPDKAACADQLLACLPGRTTATTCAVLRLLATASTPKALAAIQTARASQDPEVRDAAVRVLADWPETAALPALLDLFRTTDQDTSRVLALRGCVRLLGQGDLSIGQTVKTFAELMANAQRADERKLLLAGLAAVPDTAALELVNSLRTDPQVQDEVELARLGIASGLAATSPAQAKALATELQTQSRKQAVRDRAAQIRNQAEKVDDFITAWQVAGPYTEPEQGSSLFATVFPPEKADPKVPWHPLPAGTKADTPWMLDLQAALSGEHRVAYARTWVFSGHAQPARIEFGTDDGNRLWLNGSLVHEADRGGAATPGDFKPAVTLRQGWNALLLKVIQDTGPWEFCLRLRTPAGGTIEGLRLQASPPAE
ncbi:MAG TPA: HEAT repeat domain-containing protein [Verrucomicrobiota bacterium]|nr:HEAT repeat domain-containing protein [Verrucomicrobiota bacterium]HNU50938.1 HEAT repeat domain-containing protein [Verrucomicrobiota bacterium]